MPLARWCDGGTIGLQAALSGSVVVAERHDNDISAGKGVVIHASSLWLTATSKPRALRCWSSTVRASGVPGDPPIHRPSDQADSGARDEPTWIASSGLRT